MTRMNQPNAPDTRISRVDVEQLAYASTAERREKAMEAALGVVGEGSLAVVLWLGLIAGSIVAVLLSLLLGTIDKMIGFLLSGPLFSDRYPELSRGTGLTIFGAWAGGIIGPFFLGVVTITVWFLLMFITAAAGRYSRHFLASGILLIFVVPVLVLAAYALCLFGCPAPRPASPPMNDIGAPEFFGQAGIYSILLFSTLFYWAVAIWGFGNPMRNFRSLSLQYEPATVRKVSSARAMLGNLFPRRFSTSTTKAVHNKERGDRSNLWAIILGLTGAALAVPAGAWLFLVLKLREYESVYNWCKGIAICRALLDPPGAVVGPLLAALVVGGLLIATAVWFSRRGDRYLQEQAVSLLARDQRPPIVLLRSFKDEGATVTDIGEDGKWAATRLEDAIADELSLVGPFVAIGRPNEGLPQTGAMRQYLAETDWQATAEDWIRRARLIVVVAGTTNGLDWEVRKIQHLSALPKVLWLVRNAGRSARVARLAEQFRGTAWDGIFAEEHLEHVLAFHLEPGGRIVLFTCQDTTTSDYEVVTLQALQSLLADPRQTTTTTGEAL